MAVRNELLVLFKKWLGYGGHLMATSSLVQCRTLISTSWKLSQDKRSFESPSARLKRSFQLLDLEQDECAEEEIRKAYIRLVKKYHPDSSSGETNADHFSEVREAYKKCMNYVKNVSMTRDIHEALEQELEDLDKALGYSITKQRRLAHRHYLSYDVGVGSISQRQRAHTQQRVGQAMDNVFEQQFQKALENPDVKELAPYEKGRKVPGGKTTKSVQRIANEIIYDSMKRGEFDNLKGQGKPLKVEPVNPVLDNVEQIINKMLGNSGFAPEWIGLDKEIRTGMEKVKTEIETAWNKCGPLPMGLEQHKHWEQQLMEFEETINVINKKIFDLNLIVPSLTSQRSHLRLERLLVKVMEVPPVRPRTETMEVVKNESEVDPLKTLYERTVNTVSHWLHWWK